MTTMKTKRPKARLKVRLSQYISSAYDLLELPALPPRFDLLTVFAQAPQQPRSRKPPQPLIKPRLPRTAPMVINMVRARKKKSLMMMTKKRKLLKMRLMLKRLLPIRPKPAVLLRPLQRPRVVTFLRSQISLRSTRQRQSKLLASLTLTELEKSNLKNIRFPNGLAVQDPYESIWFTILLMLAPPWHYCCIKRLSIYLDSVPVVICVTLATTLLWSQYY